MNRLTTARKEVLQLYRDILKGCRKFQFPNEKGELWSRVLQKSARGEIEASRFEKDPVMITRLIIGGRDALHQVEERITKQQLKMRYGIDMDAEDPMNPESGKR
eukprot:TRINITY_DN13561_c0_g1_i1.p1 TRINITY_DN13561_c0_g1~~TRINITY_DN13561_c0_g1_i1.p1  ORF type:complete len:104 (+),score=4.25 TRINITY_DN13561_c0_g1_i1:47-358(+)